MHESVLPDFMSPPAWSLTLGTIGRALVLIAAALFAVSGASWLLAPRWKALEQVGKHAFTAGCTAVIGTMLSLGVLFANNRFEYAYVYGHSDHANAVEYRIAGIWSGQEGSFLLWATCAAIFALFTVWKTGIYRRWYTITTAFFLGGLTSILAFESPFNLNLVEGKPFVPADGLGLAPSLQNYWVIIHPPVIFLGFASLTCLFALAVAAMVKKDYETWLPIVRPWAIVATALVGLGLCMGGFWAYETLGWGGFWMWDPVENVSFVPWCFAAALIHGVIVQATRKKWQITNLMLAGLPFLVFVYGTFLTRSGFLSEASVHSFAEMDRSALKLLITLMGVTTLGFFGLWGVRAYQNRRIPTADVPERSFSRDGFYMIGITLLLTMGFATMIGMSVPLVQSMRGMPPRVVEEGVYHQVLSWIFVPLMLFMAVTPFVAWRGMTLKELSSKMYTSLCVTVGITGLVLYLAVITPVGRNLNLAPNVTLMGQLVGEDRPEMVIRFLQWTFNLNVKTVGLAWVMFLFGLCLFVLVANIFAAATIFKRSKMGIWSFVTHAGLAILMAGLILSRGFEQKSNALVMEGQPGRLMRYEVRYAGMTSNESDRHNQLKLEVYNAAKPDKPLFVARPGVYKLMSGGGESTMVWPHVERGWLMDTYVSLGQPQINSTDEMSLQPGKSVSFGDLLITYKEMTQSGQAGQQGTRFGAILEVQDGDQKLLVNPEMQLGGEEGPIFHPAGIADKLEVVMTGMDAADKSVRIKLQMTTPIYPVEIYHKPMTSLVWLGTGVMTLGGLLSAFYRRARRQPVAAEAPAVETPAEKPQLVTAMLGKKS